MFEECKRFPLDKWRRPAVPAALFNRISGPCVSWSFT